MRTWCTLFCFALAFIAKAQENNFWQVLAEVGFEKRKDPAGHTLDVPLFSSTLKSWNGKRVRLKGFVIPAGEVGDPKKFMLSSLPFNVCYFCGAAGPETIVQVESTERVAFSSRPIVLEGTLVLNDKDPDYHMYLIKSARVVTNL